MQLKIKGITEWWAHAERMVSALYKQTVSACWTEFVEWWTNTERKRERKVNSERTINTMWMSYEHKMNDLFISYPKLIVTIQITICIDKRFPVNFEQLKIQTNIKDLPVYYKVNKTHLCEREIPGMEDCGPGPGMEAYLMK